MATKEIVGEKSAWSRPFWAIGSLCLALAAGALLPQVRGSQAATLVFVGTAVCLGLWLLWVAMRARTRGGLSLDVVPPARAHYIQAAVQLSIYTAWAAYWPEVGRQAPLIAAQFVFVYAFEALLSWSRGRVWRLGCGPLPIVLSTNIFLWFQPEWFVCQFAMLAVAVLAKEFLRWERDGERVHIFNPSAIGLGLTSIVLIATNGTDLTSGVEIATTISRPPFIYALIFALGLVVQYFFATTLMTLSAAAVLYLLNQVHTGFTGVYHFTDVNISAAVFLGFHLLVTDPKTSPRTHSGKALFGALYGVGIWVGYSVLGDMGLPQFYDKLLPIPILNLCVRAIDQSARSGLLCRVEEVCRSTSSARFNLAAMGAWAALFVTMLSTGFVQGSHQANSVSFWMQAYEERKPGAREKLLAKLELRVLAGSGRASAALGMLHAEGRVVKESPETAALLYARASELGDLEGSILLSELFLFRRIARSDADVQRALLHLEREADRTPGGRIEGLLGYASESGEGRPRNPEHAATWYARGSQKGDLPSAQGLSRVSSTANARMDGAFEGAAKLLLAAVQAGDGRSAAHLARLYQNGLGVPKDAVRAQQLLDFALAASASLAHERSVR